MQQIPKCSVYTPENYDTRIPLFNGVRGRDPADQKTTQANPIAWQFLTQNHQYFFDFFSANTFRYLLSLEFQTTDSIDRDPPHS